MNRKETINAIAKALKKIPDIKSYLFGSSARGDFREDSDIDLLILLPDYLSSKQRVELESEICGVLFPIEMETEIPISPIMLPSKVWNERVTLFTMNVTADRVLL